jgi:hypothetical protein
VATYAQTAQKSISDLAADLTNDVYKVAGVLAAAVVAVFLEPNATVPVFSLALIVQISYILFNVHYALPAQEKRYKREKTGLEKRVNLTTELSEHERKEILAPVREADRDFVESYDKARKIYYWMCGICLALGVLAALILYIVSPETHSVQSVSTLTPIVTATTTR